MILMIHKQNNSAMSNLHTKQGCRGKGVWTGLFDFDSFSWDMAVSFKIVGHRKWP